MFLFDTKKHPPLYTLPKPERRRRLRKIIRIRRQGKTPLRLMLIGLRVGLPTHPNRFILYVWQSSFLSVRGNEIQVPLFRLRESAIAEVLEYKK